MNAIQCEGLCKQYGTVEALKPLNLTVLAGSIFGFLGRNGAGKTTTIRLLAGLAQPTAGRAWVAGEETTSSHSQARSQFGYLPQDPAFYNWMTAVEYLTYIAQLFSMSPAQQSQRIPAMLELVDLKEAAHRRIGGYSGGMKQRLGIAQALIHQPPVLLLDEPTSALDPAGRREILDLIQSLRGQVTVFFSSHILGDVERVCDTVGVIHKGELLRVAGRDELLAQYSTNTLSLDVSEESQPHLEPFLEQLKGMVWVSGVQIDEGNVRVTVTDTAVARQNILPLVVQHGLLLNRYEWVRPTLEEIFLELST